MLLKPDDTARESTRPRLAGGLTVMPDKIKGNKAELVSSRRLC